MRGLGLGRGCLNEGPFSDLRNKNLLLRFEAVTDLMLRETVWVYFMVGGIVLS